MANEDDKGTAQCHHHRIYSLTSLQIGDMQSYVSRLYLYLTCKMSKMFILVDNGPWLIDKHYSPTQLWQLMVTKSRISPFANRRTKPENEGLGRNFERRKEARTSNKGYWNHKWFSVIDAARWQDKALAPVKELHHTLHGCVVFELAWADVRGINYSNELQIDTCIALEFKSMIKKEFDSIEEAIDCIASQCSGTKSEIPVLPEASLSRWSDVKMHGCNESHSASSSEVSAQSGEFQFGLDDDMFHDVSNKIKNSANLEYDLHGKMLQDMNLTPQKVDLKPSGSGIGCRNSDLLQQDTIGSDGIEVLSEYKGASASAKLSDVNSTGSNSQRGRKSLPEISFHSSKTSSGSRIMDDLCKNRKYFWSLSSNDQTCSGAYAHSACEAVEYKDVLVVFKFCDPLLPFELKQIITSDLRLLRLLESGLPSWVIFFQSYPIFSQLYCPWMRPLARTLYILISIVTVLIGFYDLYKNVPVLKATAARICGPLFDWIEAWEMISRLKYLGTMLFLQNFEKAFKWSLTIIRTFKQLMSLLTKPMVEPLAQLGEFIMPFWSVCVEEAVDYTDAIWLVMTSIFSGAANLLQILVWPLVIILSTVWGVVTAIMYPVASAFWELLVAPIRLFLMFLNSMGLISSEIVDFGKRTWQTLSGTFQLISNTQPTSNTNTVSVWRALWNDLFSQVFRAIRSIVNGFVTFFIACNKHRLSTYNHLAALLEHLCNVLHIRHSVDINSSGNVSRMHGKTIKPQDRVDKEHNHAYKSLGYPNISAAKSRWE
ncbi:uncharacterized protein LOC131029212 [Cryptomeria japonica]|uniref:uncharacterized protein LOC131029212 n=1 Tax=Cryptomeria japonica TaxID=3369 RepID=UPI0027DA226B|nr:uncharacterized protein LOC131029212 [Cryptomeria japonica]XP_057815606.2 uncharacterized protein LOC131029212 [Cryptomeria japonica]